MSCWAAALFYGMGAALSVNCDFDRSEPHLERITEGREEHTAWLHDGLLGSH